jgi:hypothetical protein
VVIDNMIALGNPKSGAGKGYADEDGYEYDYAATEGGTAPAAAEAKAEEIGIEEAPKEDKKSEKKEVIDTDDIPF